MKLKSIQKDICFIDLRVSFKNLDSKQVAELKEAFAMVDSTNDSSLDPTELNQFLNNCGLVTTVAEVDSMMKKNLDSVTGKVSFPQFLEIFDDQNTIGDVEKTPEDAFRLLSPDGEPITVQHLIKFFGQFPEDIAKEELEAVHRLCDEDKDGVWTLEEFSKLYKGS